MIVTGYQYNFLKRGLQAFLTVDDASCKCCKNIYRRLHKNYPTHVLLLPVMRFLESIFFGNHHLRYINSVIFFKKRLVLCSW